MHNVSVLSEPAKVGPDISRPSCVANPLLQAGPLSRDSPPITVGVVRSEKKSTTTVICSKGTKRVKSKVAVDAPNLSDNLTTLHFLGCFNLDLTAGESENAGFPT